MAMPEKSRDGREEQTLYLKVYKHSVPCERIKNMPRIARHIFCKFGFIGENDVGRCPTPHKLLKKLDQNFC